MKAMKKIVMMLICICLVVPCFAVVSHADNNAIRFNDPKTKTAEEFEVTGYVETTSAVSGVKLVFSYDTEYLKFISGNSIVETTPGKLEYRNVNSYESLPATGRLVFAMKFQALKEGTTKVTIAEADIESAVASWKQGNSTIKIEKGEEVVITDPETTTPETTTPETTTPETTDPETTTPETTTPETTDPETTIPETTDPEPDTNELMISNATSITLITDVSDIILPEKYIETSVVVGGEEYPAWQDSDNSEFYIIYAESSNGATSLYQYDALENTYQRFTLSLGTEEEDSILDDIETVLGSFAEYAVIGVGAVLLIFIVLVIVLSVKLYNRNAELDEIYDEYGIDVLDDEATDKNKVVAEIAEEVKEQEMVCETEDDVILQPEEESQEENEPVSEDKEASSVDVEAYVQQSIKEFFEEPVEETRGSVEEALTEVKETEDQEDNVSEKTETVEEFFDEEDDETFDELKNNFKVDFIDLDD